MSGPTNYDSQGLEMFTEQRPAIVQMADFMDYINEMRDIYDETITLNQAYQDFLDNRLPTIESDLFSFTKKPLFVEMFISFGRLGSGVPDGLTNYENGNYVCSVVGTKGEKTVTVTSGNISHGSGVWLAVIEDDQKNYTINKVVSITGNKFNLLEPLKNDITNGKIGNVHDASQGLHYSELGYYAFAQHIFKSSASSSERLLNQGQFLGKNDYLKLWNLNTSFSVLNSTSNVDNPSNKTLRKFGTASLVMNMANANHKAELEIAKTESGYLEIFISSEKDSVLEYYIDNKLTETHTIQNIVKRIVLKTGVSENVKVKVYDPNATLENVNQLFIGNTTYFLNQFHPDRMIDPNDKIVYIGDSWGTYHNQATTRELKRLMMLESNKGEVLNFSRAGHTTNYALDGFQKYVIDNKPKTVIIEYFCNDFATINGANLGTFTAVDGSQKNMNVTTLNQYISNIEKMVYLAIKNGIQPIVIMPSVTDSMSRNQDFLNKTSSIWLGKSDVIENIDLPEIKTRKVIQSGSTTYGNALEMLTTEENAGARVGFKTNTDKTITGGYLESTFNNGVKKGGVMHDGRLVYPSLQTTPEYGTRTPNTDNRGLIYSFDGQPDNVDDQLRVVIRKSDGSYVTKKIQLID